MLCLRLAKIIQSRIITTGSLPQSFLTSYPSQQNSHGQHVTLLINSHPEPMPFPRSLYFIGGTIYS